MSSILEQYRISDFLEWHRDKKLRLDPDFQRGSVWTPSARTYLIDTILIGLPIPKIYLRTQVDVATKRSFREVVDGQQRLRAIIDFADDRFTLSGRSEDFAGAKYSTLDSSLQQAFLEYPIAVGQLLNASDDDVLEVFARLNSYSVQLNAAEKRHAQFQGEFKWAVRAAARRWKILWNEYGVVTTRQRVRMLDDSLMAEMFGVVIEGVRDGGQPKITKLYQKQDNAFSPSGPEVTVVDQSLELILREFAEDLKGTPVLKGPHFLMLFSAVAHALAGIPEGDLKEEEMPERDGTILSDLNLVRANLMKLASVMDADEPPSGFEDFWRASKSSTQRIASRRVRFPLYFAALRPNEI